jgi:hypothetical protein
MIEQVNISKTLRETLMAIRSRNKKQAVTITKHIPDKKTVFHPSVMKPCPCTSLQAAAFEALLI